jgi:hypothetical protein
MIVAAKHIKNYEIELTYESGAKVVKDFKKDVFLCSAPYLKKYRDMKHFIKFKIEEGNIVWGKDWDLIFDIDKERQWKMKK